MTVKYEGKVPGTLLATRQAPGNPEVVYVSGFLAVLAGWSGTWRRVIS